MNLTSLLTLIAMFDSVRSEVPKVSYISFMDIWMTVCVIIIFLAIAEYAVSHSLTRFKMKKKAICIDKISRVVMMGLFVCFNLIYWPLLLQKCVFCKIDNQRHAETEMKLKVFWIGIWNLILSFIKSNASNQCTIFYHNHFHLFQYS